MEACRERIQKEKRRWIQGKNQRDKQEEEETMGAKVPDEYQSKEGNRSAWGVTKTSMKETKKTEEAISQEEESHHDMSIFTPDKKFWETTCKIRRGRHWQKEESLMWQG